MVDHKLLALRKAMKAKKPHFKRQDWHKKARLKPSWRKPKGMDSKLRKHMHGHGYLPTTGYRSPAAIRGMHKSGLIPLLVHTLSQLDGVDGKTHGVIIASTVGQRKQVDIITKAQSKSVRVLNIKDAAKFVQTVKDEMGKRKQAAKAVEKKPEPKAAPKQPAKQPDLSQEEKKEHEKREAEKVLTGK